MIKKIFKYSLVLLTLFMLLSLTACGFNNFEENLIKQGYTYKGIDIDCGKDVYFTYEESQTLSPTVYERYNKPDEDFDLCISVEFTVDKEMYIDTSKPGTYTFNFTVQAHNENDYNKIEEKVIEKKIYVVDFKTQDGTYYTRLYNYIYSLDFKIEDGKAYRYDNVTNEFLTVPYEFDCIETYTHMESLDFDGNTIYSYDNVSHVYFKNSEEESMPFLTFIIEDGEPKLVETYKEDDTNLIKINADNPMCNIFALVKENNKLSQKQIDNLKGYGDLYLDSEKKNLVTTDTVITGNELYCYYEQNDYTGYEFLGSYYWDDEPYITFEANKALLPYYEDMYYNYSATQTAEGWIITLPNTNYSYINGVLTADYDTDYPTVLTKK